MRILATILAFWIAALAAAETPTTEGDGLSVTLRADSAAVTIGAAVDFQVSLAFDTSIASPKTRMLNRYRRAASLSL